MMSKHHVIALIFLLKSFSISSLINGKELQQIMLEKDHKLLQRCQILYGKSLQGDQYKHFLEHILKPLRTLDKKSKCPNIMDSRSHEPPKISIHVTGSALRWSISGWKGLCLLKMLTGIFSPSCAVLLP